MRLIRNILIALVFFILLIWGVLSLLPLFSNDEIEGQGLQSIQFKDAAVKLAYILDRKDWLNYALQPGEDRVRVMSNAIIDKEYALTESERFLYAIDYEVLDGKANVIKAGRFYHRGGQKHYQDQKTGQQYVSTSLYPPVANPLDSRIHIINLRGLENAEKIRLKLAEYQAPVQNVVVRAYQKKQVSEHKLDYAWQRLGDRVRKQLAKVSVYDADVMTEQEKRQLIKNMWAPMGPLGVDGEDYFIQKLYVVREIENDIQLNVPPVPSSGLVIYPDRYGMITLPDNNNNMTLNWKLFDNAGVPGSHDSITIEWWGRPATRYKKWQVKLTQNSFRKIVGTGVLRISTDRPIVVRAWLKDENTDDNEITPKPAYLRLYSPAESGLEYKVNHIRGFKTPYRFDLRAFGEQQSAEITYQLLSASNRIIKSGSLKLKQQLSPYDAVVADSTRWLTEPQHVYFNLPRAVSRVRFSAVPGVWISAFTRPKNLSHVNIDPMTEEERKLAMPAWFAVRPVQWKNYLIKSRSQLITIQRRPPQIDPQMLAGLYQWQQFLPEGEWKGRYILNRMEDQKTLREEALPSRYIKLGAGQGQKVAFVSRSGTSSLRPSLIYSFHDASEKTLSVWLDDQLYYRVNIDDINGELRLPYVNDGQYNIRVESRRLDSGELLDGDFYINYTHSLQQLFLKRMAIEIPAGGMQFKVHKKSDNELLAVRIYTSRPVNQKVNVRVKLRGGDDRPIGPMQDWTIARRVYQMAPVENATEPLMLNVEHEAGAERIFFIPLGRDLPKNREYAIDLEVTNNIPAYVVLTRTIAGLYPSRQLYPDIELEADK